MTVSTSDLQASTLKLLGVNSDDTVLLARALEWLNEAMDEIMMFVPEAEFFQKSYMTIDTVASQAVYSLPSNFFYLSELVDEDNQTPLKMITREKFDRLYPDPTSDNEDSPSEYTLEYDPSRNLNVMRLWPIPDDVYTLKAVMRCWHETLSDSQDIPWDKLESAIKRRAAYYGAFEVYNSPDDAHYRAELGQLSGQKMILLQQFLAMQRPKPRQIPTVLRKSEY
jgi:hypothetical protein